MNGWYKLSGSKAKYLVGAFIYVVCINGNSYRGKLIEINDGYVVIFYNNERFDIAKGFIKRIVRDGWHKDD